MSELISDLLGDVFSFDSRVWRSLLPLVFKPGHLTADYLDGRRVRYIPPFRLYLVTSLAFFALSSLLGDDIEFRIDDERAGRQVIEEVRQEFEVARQELTSGVEQVAPQSELVATESQAAVNDSASSDSAFAEAPETGVCELLEGRLSPGWRPIAESCKKIAVDGGLESLLSALRDNVPMMMFLFMPLVALSMKLLYPLAKRKYVEHLLFFLHFHAFFFLLMSVGILLDRPAKLMAVLTAPVELLMTVGYIYLPIYLFLAMRRVYRQGRFATSMKYVLLVIAYAVTLAVSLLLTLGYTAINL